MKKMIVNSALGLLCVVLMTACNKPDEPVNPTIDTNPELVAACQHIEGGGAKVKGGDGGTIYRVSRLDDEADPNTGLPMAGTLRYAVNQTGARRVVFTTSGTIHLQKELRIKTGSITIDGQTAPGDGISVNNSQGVVLDHLSCSWSVDECVSCYGNTDFTMQYCIVSESLKESIHGKGSHGYGGIWGGTNASFHHNLLAHHDSRNPRFDHDYVNTSCTGPIDFVNNVVYNWGGNSAYGGEGSTNGGGGRHINFVNNYFKPGPSTKSSVKERLVDPWTSCSNCTDRCGGSVTAPKIFLTGNTMTSSASVTSDNWTGSTKSKSVAGTDSRWTNGLTPLTIEQTASEAYETVLTKAGCSLHRDAIDTRIVNDVRNTTGKLINTQSEVGGWPQLQTADKPLDSDYDGIPDEWETQFGLNPKDPLDGKAITLVTGYTNLEVYLRHLVRNLY